MPIMVPWPHCADWCEELRLPRVFSTFIRTGLAPGNRQLDWHAPSAVFDANSVLAQSILSHLPSFDQVVPLAEEGDVPALLGVGVVAGKATGFIESVYEAPHETTVFPSYDNFMAYRFHCHLDQEWPLDELRILAGEFEFFRFEELHAVLEPHWSDYEARQKLVRNFI